MENDLTLYCDGASRGNPGPAAIGAVLYGSGGDKILAVSLPLGEATNNVAEYIALIAGLEATLLYIRLHSASAGNESPNSHRLQAYMDSELVVRQINGKYSVKSPRLRKLHGQAKKRLNYFHHWTLTHVPRHKNKPADALANQALDENDE